MQGIAVYATDLHGETKEYERVLEIASGKNVKALIIGGDVSPFLTVIGDIGLYQREFMESYLIPRLLKFRKDTKKDVFIITGNDDVKVNEKVMRKGEKKGAFKLMNMKACKLGDYHIAGYPYINEAPFLLKDWEKDEKEIEKDLERLSKKSPPEKTIYLMHAPPLGTALDVIFSGEHVGSSAIRKFIEEMQPYLTLHGHIHESPRMTGTWRESIGKSVSVNPGKGSVLVFGIGDLKTMEILDV